MRYIGLVIIFHLQFHDFLSSRYLESFYILHLWFLSFSLPLSLCLSLSLSLSIYIYIYIYIYVANSWKFRVVLLGVWAFGFVLPSSLGSSSYTFNMPESFAALLVVSAFLTFKVCNRCRDILFYFFKAVFDFYFLKNKGFVKCQIIGVSLYVFTIKVILFVVYQIIFPFLSLFLFLLV